MQKMNTINEATEAVGKLLKEEYSYPLAVTSLNQGRYKIMHYKNEKILVVFKREPFHSFNKQFDTDSGWGESINKIDFDKAVEKGVRRIFFCYNDGKIYVIHYQTILKNAQVRTTDNEGKETYSFDIKLLNRYKEDKK